MRSLKVFLKVKRNDLVEEALQFAKDTCEEMGIPVVKRRTVRRKKTMPEEKAAVEPMTFYQEMKRSMLECIDKFQKEIDTRCEDMACISDRFAVLEPSNLIKISETELIKFVQRFVKNYNELSADGILTEIASIRRFRKADKVP
ncbi:hypothetical protein AVEN_188762-1 [Araneus ventricosus]|uniref:Uncharacterized protein n=1 Tax=Araneus ventricosus TaxID=182803 RepID=A0A4Y2SAD0_ARAVE|nr:hypothetical protein AVEN_188762-1 [Araneus ventricosus]